MSFILLGFITGLSLILALGAQNIFIIEQGLKKNYIFLVCSICAFSDFLLIFLGIFIFTKGIQVLTKTQSYTIKYDGPEKTTLQRIKDFVK